MSSLYLLNRELFVGSLVLATGPVLVLLLLLLQLAIKINIETIAGKNLFFFAGDLKRSIKRLYWVNVLAIKTTISRPISEIYLIVGKTNVQYKKNAGQKVFKAGEAIMRQAGLRRGINEERNAAFLAISESA